MLANATAVKEEWMSNISFHFFTVKQSVFQHVGNYPSRDAFIGKINEYSRVLPYDTLLRRNISHAFMLQVWKQYMDNRRYSICYSHRRCKPLHLRTMQRMAQGAVNPLVLSPCHISPWVRKQWEMLGKSGCLPSFDCHMCRISQEERGQDSNGKSISTSTRHLMRNQALLPRRRTRCQRLGLCNWGGTHGCLHQRQSCGCNVGGCRMLSSHCSHTVLRVGILMSHAEPWASQPARLRYGYITAVQAEGLSDQGCCCCYIVQVGFQYIPKDLSSLTCL